MKKVKEKDFFLKNFKIPKISKRGFLKKFNVVFIHFFQP